MLEGLFARIAASIVGSYVKKGVGLLTMIPQPVWEAAAVIGYALAFLALHQHYAHEYVDKAVKAAVAKNDAAWQKAFADERVAAGKWRQATELQSRLLTEQRRKLNDEEQARITADARDVLVRGPGKASAGSCRPGAPAGVPVAASDPGSRPGADERPSLPANDGFAVVPWNWLVNLVQEHDAWRADALTYKASWQEQAAWWEGQREKLRQTLAKSTK